MWLIDSLPGMYAVQTFLHSLIAILVIERAMQIWRIKNPGTQFRYRIMTLILPVFMLPFYQLVNFERSSFFFRQETALFNMNSWLSLELWNVIPLRVLFMLLLAGTSLVFFLQEMLPVIRDALAGKDSDESDTIDTDPEITGLVRAMSDKLGIVPPPVSVIDDSYPFIFTSGAKNHSIVLSSGLTEVLDRQQLQSALAHELAHIARLSNATKWMIFVIRVLMFFNPIVLVVFRRVVQDDEHICDDITVSLTGEPAVLASTLRVFFDSHSEIHSASFGGITALKEGMENYSHNLLLRERIVRLESERGYEDREFEWGKFLLTVTVVAAINYFVV